MTLILLPNLLDESADIDLYFPKNIKTIVASLEGIIAEDEKNARRYLLRFIDREKLQKLPIKLLNEHTKDDDILDLLRLVENKKIGLISDAGLPCIADPGSKLIKRLKDKNIEIRAYPGPSSIFLALMLSGLNAQKFAFQGYLPRKEDELILKLKKLEKESSQNNITQIFIEAPYRSDKMLNCLVKTLNKETLLSVAINLTSKEEKIITKRVLEFKKLNLVIGKNPTVFLFRA